MVVSGEVDRDAVVGLPVLGEDPVVLSHGVVEPQAGGFSDVGDRPGCSAVAERTAGEDLDPVLDVVGGTCSATADRYTP